MEPIFDKLATRGQKRQRETSPDPEAYLEQWTIVHLGNELLDQLLSWLDYVALGKASIASKAFNELVITHQLWRRLFQRDFPVQAAVVWNKNEPTRMKEYAREFLDGWTIEYRRGNLETYWKRYYEWMVKNGKRMEAYLIERQKFQNYGAQNTFGDDLIAFRKRNADSDSNIIEVRLGNGQYPFDFYTPPDAYKKQGAFFIVSIIDQTVFAIYPTMRSDGSFKFEFDGNPAEHWFTQEIPLDELEDIQRKQPPRAVSSELYLLSPDAFHLIYIAPWMDMEVYGTVVKLTRENMAYSPQFHTQLVSEKIK